MADPLTTQKEMDKSDPSALTTSQLWREIAALKELFETRLSAVERGIEVAHQDVVRVPTEVQKQVGALRDLIEVKFENGTQRHSEIDERIALIRNVLETRLDGYDTAIELLQATADKFPARMDEKIAASAGVHEEKFRSIQTQFAERDTRTDQTSRDSKVAVDAALQAAKELVAQQNTSNSLAISKSEAATTKQIDQQGLLIQTTAKSSDEKIDDIKERLTRIEGKGSGRQDMWGWVVAAIAVLLSLYVALRPH